MLRKKTATSCNKHPEVQPVCYCKKCKIYMCDACKSAHTDDTHSVIPIESLMSFDLLNGYCPDHPDYHMDLMCNDCNGTYYKNTFTVIIAIYLLLKNFIVLSVREAESTKDIIHLL